MGLSHRQVSVPCLGNNGYRDISLILGFSWISEKAVKRIICNILQWIKFFIATKKTSNYAVLITTLMIGRKKTVLTEQKKNLILLLYCKKRWLPNRDFERKKKASIYRYQLTRWVCSIKIKLNKREDLRYINTQSKRLTWVCV